MKLLLLNYEYPPLGGGAGRAMQSIAKQLIKMGYDVDVITSHTSLFWNLLITSCEMVIAFILSLTLKFCTRYPTQGLSRKS